MPKGKHLHRRDFLRGSVGIGCLAMVPSCGGVRKEGDPLAVGEMPAGQPETLPVLDDFHPRVAGAWVPRGSVDSSYPLYRKAVEAATDFAWLSRGDRVLIKLALNSGNPFPATTDPWSLWCMVKLLREKGAGEILVGDQSGVQSVHWTRTDRRGRSRDLCRRAGLLRIIDETGATPCFFEERGYDAYNPVTLPPGSHWGEPFWVTNALDEADHLIYLSRTSSHVMGDITSGFKLGVGLLREDSRLEFHKGGRDFYAMYEEVNAAPPVASKLRLAVCSGRKVLSNLGPDDGHVSEPDHGLVFASEDLLAHELLSYAWLQWNREFATPEYSNGTTGRLTRMRSTINRLFVWYVWRSRRGGGAPALPLWQAGNIHDHPAVVNHLLRKGGRPAALQWEQVNRGPDQSVVDNLEARLRA